MRKAHLVLFPREALIRSALKSHSNLNSLSYDLETIWGVQLNKTMQFTLMQIQDKKIQKIEKTKTRNRNIQMEHLKSTSQVFSQFWNSLILWGADHCSKQNTAKPFSETMPARARDVLINKSRRTYIPDQHSALQTPCCPHYKWMNSIYFTLSCTTVGKVMMYAIFLTKMKAFVLGLHKNKCWMHSSCCVPLKSIENIPHILV